MSCCTLGGGQEADAWKRRGQTRAARGLVVDGLQDLNKAIYLHSTDADAYLQRGICLHQMKNYRYSLDDFKRYNELGGDQTARVWNYIGMCESQLGNVSEALAAYRQSIALDDSLLEPHINYAQILKEGGRWKEADAAFEALMRAMPGASQVYYYWGGFQYAMGWSMDCLGHMRQFLEAMNIATSRGVKVPGVGDKEVISALVTCALSLQALGAYGDAIDYFNKALRQDAKHVCRVQKHILLYYHRRLDWPLSDFNIDNDFTADWKERWCKVLDCPEQIIPDETEEEAVLLRRYPVPFVENDMTGKLLAMARQLSPWVQLNAPGFLPHRRVQRGFGLAVLQMAQTLVQNLLSLRKEGRSLQVRHAGSSQSPSAFSHETDPARVGEGENHMNDRHPFGYRDFMDIAVKWRQLSEPNDTVWWIDRLPRKSFEEGFGLQTPMVNGQLKCIRYHSYCAKGIAALKSLAMNGYHTASSQRRQLTSKAKKKLSMAQTLEEVYACIGEDFYVVCPCISSVDNSTILEGTRLTLTAKPPDGFDFSIRCPALPSKWVAMDAELHSCFNEIMLLLVGHNAMSEEENQRNQDALLQASLKFFFYWTNFSPLSRGSALCGYAAIMAVMLAARRVITSPIPEGLQFDWEAIFTPEPSVFVDKIAPLISTDAATFSFNEWDFAEGLPNLHAVLTLLSSA